MSIIGIFNISHNHAKSVNFFPNFQENHRKMENRKKVENHQNMCFVIAKPPPKFQKIKKVGRLLSAILCFWDTFCR